MEERFAEQVGRETERSEIHVGAGVMGCTPHQVAPLLHLQLPEGHALFEVAIDWPGYFTLADLERRLVDLGCLPLPGHRIDRLIVRIGASRGLWRFSARTDWRRRDTLLDG